MLFNIGIESLKKTVNFPTWSLITNYLAINTQKIMYFTIIARSIAYATTMAFKTKSNPLDTFSINPSIIFLPSNFQSFS